MLIGKEIGPFLVEKEIGSGAMGAVFQGREQKSGKRVAIKIISMALTANENALKRFKRESAILKQLAHPNIVRLLASGRFHGTPFYVMEYVEGESLDHVIARRGRLSWEEVVEMGMQLCGALQHAHGKGIIHRDLKPSNLMILRDQKTVKLTDFGIAKDTDMTQLTAANSTVGTAAYMSPEQCRGAKDITYKADLYSMGVMFYELLTGRKPFQAETTMEMFLQHANAPFIRPSKIVHEIPVWLDNLVCQLLEKKPESRPLNAETVAEAMQIIKQKVETQKSAGIDAATKRRIDRTTNDQALTNEEKDLARMLLGKKKKKKKSEPFYQQNWFTVTAVSLILATLIGFIGWTFFAAPGAEALYAQAEQQMQSPRDEDRRAAREGAIRDFLYYYPEYGDTNKLKQMQAWADQVDTEILARQVANRWNMKPENESESATRVALDEMDLGKLDTAAKLWSDLITKHKDAKGEDRTWGLLAERNLKEVREIRGLYDHVKVQIQTEELRGKKYEPSTPFEKAAIDAVRAEEDRKLDKALGAWDDLMKLTESKLGEQRQWYLLAAWQHRILRDLVPMKKSTP